MAYGGFYLKITNVVHFLRRFLALQFSQIGIQDYKRGGGGVTLVFRLFGHESRDYRDRHVAMHTCTNHPTHLKPHPNTNPLLAPRGTDMAIPLLHQDHNWITGKQKTGRVRKDKRGMWRKVEKRGLQGAKRWGDDRTGIGCRLDMVGTPQ